MYFIRRSVLKANAKIAASNEALLSSREQPLVVESNVVVAGSGDSVGGELAAEMKSIDEMGDEVVEFGPYASNKDSVFASAEETFLAFPTFYDVYAHRDGGARIIEK